jgi:hypothetical protein
MVNNNMQNNKRRVTCPKCGFGITIDISRKFVCKCGYDSTGSEPLKIRVIPEWEIRRVGLCQGCPNYHDYRCTKVEFGCRPAFIQFVQDPNAQCPIGRWGKEN